MVIACVSLFREHSVKSRENSVQFREHSVEFYVCVVVQSLL
jgi:hypothetical protein